MCLHLEIKLQSPFKRAKKNQKNYTEASQQTQKLSTSLNTLKRKFARHVEQAVVRETQLWNTIVDTATLRDSADKMFVTFYVLPYQMICPLHNNDSVVCCYHRVKDKQERLLAAEDALATCEKNLTRTTNKLTAFQKKEESVQELRRQVNKAQLNERELTERLAKSTKRYSIRMHA